MKSLLAELNMRYFNSANGYSNKFYVAIRLLYGWVSSKKKVWSQFRSSQRRLWQTHSKINDAIPHT